MRVLSKVNNNVVLCEDGDGKQIVALGRGLGFLEIGSEVELSRIQRTFYDADQQNISLLESINPDLFAFSSQVADFAASILAYRLSKNFAFILADHLEFAIKRTQEGIQVHMPLAYEIEQQYPEEYKLGGIVRNGISKTFSVLLPTTEIAGIAMCFINNIAVPESVNTSKDENAGIDFETLLSNAIEIIERALNLRIDRASFNFSRFATHFNYLFKRLETGEAFEKGNGELYAAMVAGYPHTAACTDEVCALLEKEFGEELTDEEKLYLMLHINRMCSKAEVEDSEDKT